MKPIPAIVEPAFDADLVAEQVIVALADLKAIENKIVRVRGQLEDALGAVRARRLDLGRWLSRARAAWPQRGPNAKGWGEFLARVKIPESTARMYIAEYRDPEGFAEKKDQAQRKLLGSGPEAGDRDIKPDNVESGPETDDEIEIDRDTWCTPKWLTDAIGEFDLDPCSNERSSVRSTTKFALDLGVDGLAHAEDVQAGWRVFVNPPYSDVGPWITAYGHTRFCFLLKLDTSTRWFADLIERTQLILIPRLKRIGFVPPPGVPPEKAAAQQFPHALFYARIDDATPEIRALCYHWHVEHVATADLAQANPALHIVR
jgi:hypothetical protein